ncbi:MAG: dUTP diphosphatase [Pseudomonadales bacterium]|nr:dUTP diphosphatase [Pseudomonadales bacterium]NIX09967.1 dUTP diphosphatase [Pseudomonadales bacterium]
MAEMQDSHNRHVHPDWINQGYAYYRAVWVECAELLDHFGWKWWKKQEPDLGQVKLEVVDIWHFGLSDLIRAGTLGTAAPALLEVSAAKPTDLEAFRLAVESLAADTLANRAFAMAPFAAVMESLPLSFAELFEMYVGKNVLNNFRQDHGYKTGEYQKLWQGREDNEHLIDILGALDCPAEAVPGELYRALEARYPA